MSDRSAWDLAQALDGARCVVFDGDCELVGAWFGGATFNVYTLAGNCVDTFTVYDCDAQDAQAALVEHLRCPEGDPDCDARFGC